MLKQLPILMLALLAVVIAMAAGFGVALLATTMTKPAPTAQVVAASTTTDATINPANSENTLAAVEPTTVSTASAAASTATISTSVAVTSEAPANSSAAVRELQQPAVAVTDPVVPQAAFAEDNFSSSESGWPVNSTETWSAQYVDGRYQMMLKGSPTIGFSFPLPTEQYRLGVDVTVRGGNAGVIFLFAEPSTFYQLVIDEQQRYAIQRIDGDTITNIVDWTPSEALGRESGVAARLRVRREGTLVHCFANDELLTEFTVPPGEVVSRYGFVLNSENGEAEATFDNLIGERLLAP